MESKSINRYRSFCRSLENLEKSLQANPKADFVLVRNQLAHDYDGTFAAEKFSDIINIYCPLFEQLKKNIEKYYPAFQQ